MNIFFFLKSKTLTAKKTPNTLYCRFSVPGGKPIPFSTKIKILDNQKWNHAHQQIEGQDQIAVNEKNNRLGEIKTYLRNIYNQESSGGTPSFKNIKNHVVQYKKKLRRNMPQQIAEQDYSLEYLSLKKEMEILKKQCEDKSYLAARRSEPLSKQTLENYIKSLNVILEFLSQTDYNINELDMGLAQNRPQKKRIQKLGENLFVEFHKHIKSQKERKRSFGQTLTNNQKQQIKRLEDKISLKKEKYTNKLQNKLQELGLQGYVYKEKYSCTTCRNLINELKLFIARINKDLCTEIYCDYPLPKKQLDIIHVLNFHQLSEITDQTFIYKLIDDLNEDQKYKGILRKIYLIVQMCLTSTSRRSDLASFTTKDIKVQTNNQGVTEYRVYKINQKNGRPSTFVCDKKFYEIVKQAENGNISSNFISNHIKKLFAIIPSFQELVQWKEYNNNYEIVHKEAPACEVYTAHALRKTAISLMGMTHNNSEISKVSGHAPGSKVIDESYKHIYEETFDAKNRKYQDFLKQINLREGGF